MGGFSYDAIERYPNLFAAAMPVCSGGDVSKAASIARVYLGFLGSDDGSVDPRYSLNIATNALMKPAHAWLPCGDGTFFVAGGI